MAEQFRDVRFTTGAELKVEGIESEYEEGKTYPFPVTFATMLSTRWNMGEIVSESYEVADHEVEEKIGKEVRTGSLEDMGYRELQSLAKENDLKASGSKEDIIERLKEADVEP